NKSLMYLSFKNNLLKNSWIPSSITGIYFLLLSLCLISCGGEPPITEVNFEEAEFASFVEPDFPFITTSMDGRKLGQGFPEDNLSARVLALRLGNDAYVGFDTDLLRWAVAWTGEFLPMVTMAQISYNDFHNKSNQLPVINGDPKIATGVYAGWSGPEPLFNDPRPPASNPKGLPWGPLPEEIGRWNGVYLVDQEVVLSYTVHGTAIVEKPGSLKIEDQTAFTRNLRVAHHDEALSLVAAEVTDASRSEVIDNVAHLYHGVNEEAVTTVGLAGNLAGVEIKVIDNRYIVVQLSAESEDLEFSL